MHQAPIICDKTSNGSTQPNWTLRFVGSEGCLRDRATMVANGAGFESDPSGDKAESLSEVVAF